MSPELKDPGITETMLGFLKLLRVLLLMWDILRINLTPLRLAFLVAILILCFIMIKVDFIKLKMMKARNLRSSNIILAIEIRV